jgi:invasion protein IalB
MRQAHWRKTFLVTALLCASGPSLAQPAATGAAPSTPPPQAAQELAPTDVKTFGDWVVRCFPFKSLAQCDMFQMTSEKATQRRIVSTSIAYAPSLNGYVAKIVVPLGVQIAAGVTVTSDKYRSKALEYARCENDGCYIEGPVDTVLVEKLTDGKSAGITITLPSGRPAALPLSLRGFAEAAAAMKALAMKKSQPSVPPKAGE